MQRVSRASVEVGGETVGLHDHGETEVLTSDRAQRLGLGVAHQEPCCGDPMAFHELLGEHLARLESGGGLAGPKKRSAGGDESVSNPLRKW